jgi:chemosensory pili system protein ChpA (sensor histidine kinase/response regulator)
MDMWLPDGSGFELLDWMAEQDTFKDIPVVVFTASTNADHAQRAKDLGVARYLQKPAQFGRLVAVIKEELQAAGERKASGSMSGSTL